MKISIITATWNCVDTLQCTLDSISAQTYTNREHIVVDGFSTDGTYEVLKRNSKNIDTLIREHDNGIYDALNKGINNATGDIVGFLHADDVYASNDVLKKIASRFQDNSVAAVFGDLVYVSPSDTSRVIRLWKSNDFKNDDLLRGWMPPHPTLYIRKEWYQKINGFNINYKISADYLSTLTLFKFKEFKTEYISDVLIKMRLGGASNRSIGALFKKSKEDFCALRSTGFGIFQSFYALSLKNLRKISQFFVK